MLHSEISLGRGSRFQELMPVAGGRQSVDPGVHSCWLGARNIQAFPGQIEVSSRQPESLDDSMGWRLSVRSLSTTAQIARVAQLRKYAPVDAEQDLSPGAADLEGAKDRFGIVHAILLDKTRFIATIRAVPTGQNLTLTESVWSDLADCRDLTEPGTLEIGRLIVAPEFRRADLLPKYFRMCLGKLITDGQATHLHASCSPLLARLYRRFGFSTRATIRRESGLEHVLIGARVEDVARALHVSNARVNERTRQVRTLCGISSAASHSIAFASSTPSRSRGFGSTLSTRPCPSCEIIG